MKIFTGLIIFTLISLSAFSQLQDPLNPAKEKKLKTDVVGSYPTEVWEYMWNVEMWAIHQQKLISYTSFGEPSEVTIIGDAGDTKTIYTYNSNQLLTETISQNKEDGVWVNNRRDRYEYTDDMLESQVLIESWVGGEWVLVEGSQYSYNTDQEGVIISTVKIWSRDDNAWINSIRTTVTYGSEMLVAQAVSENWEDGSWVYFSKVDYTYSDGRITEMYYSGWENGAWAGSTKMIYEYRENESYTMTIYTGSEANWTPSQRFTYDYDSHGNATMSQVEIYAGVWMVLSGSEYLLTYDGDNLVERITRVTNMAEPGVWKNSYKEEFKSFASLSTNPLEAGIESISHYPNPAGEFVSLDIQNLNNKNLDIIILDLSGKVLKTDQVFVPLSNFKYILDLNDLSSGIYIIQAREKSGKLIQSMRVIHEE